MTIPPRSGRWTKKSAQPPAGLEHYDFEGFHGLATPDRVGPWYTFEDSAEDHSPEAQEANRANREAYREFSELESSIHHEFGEDAVSVWSDDVSGTLAQRINHAMDNIHPDLKHLVSPAPANDPFPAARVHDFLGRYFDHTLGSTRCPRCIAHIIGEAMDSMKEVGTIEDSAWEHWFDDGTLNKLREKYTYGDQTTWTPEYHRQVNIHDTKITTEIFRVFNNGIRGLVDIARQNKGRTCPLHSGM